LDAGERAAIVLAKADERNAVLAMDDQAGRQVARQLDVPVTGLIGVLLRLKEMREIDEVTPHLETARDRGYWLSDGIIARARHMVSEAPVSD
jgi:predicted nucleic acid-binding protein